jgi:hypothetical protein
LRQLVAAVMLVLFAAANYAVQTHVHGDFHAAPIAAAKQVISVPVVPGSSDTDENHCPLCLELLSGGKFLAAVPPVWILPVLAGFAHPFGQTLGSAHAHGHNWQSRGPPAR